ncbi:diguanylate cyclase [Herbaspirillum lusitanum]|uniref:diguanylate cyclase n=2 Tax=Herbaspirillum lusitanum TaxID=213312 RepID=A0ABW9A9R5_9BURK
MVFGLCAWMLYKSHDEARHYAVETSQNITLIAQRDIQRNIEILSLSLDSLTHRYQHPSFRQLSREQQRSYLFGSTLPAKHVEVMAVLDHAGKVLVSSMPGDARNTYGDRPYFTEQRDKPDLGLYISKPIDAKFARGLQVIVLSKRLSNEDGSFAGVVLMALNLSYFRDLFSGLQLGEAGVMSLYSRDGVVYMRLPSTADAIGRDISTSPGFQQIKPMMARDSGSFVVRAITDGVQRLYAFRNIPGTELMVFVGRSEQDIFMHWRDSLYAVASLMLLFSIACVLLLRVVRREFRQRQEAEEKLRTLVRIDGLTGLLNRRALDDMLAALWGRCRRQEGSFSLLFIDVDYFKFYNDNYGHQQGDEVLVAVAQTIAGQLPRSSDIAARYGGEEFIVVLEETDADGALLVGEKIRAAIEQLNILHARSQCGHVTASIGAATYRRELYADIDAVLNAADAALYQAKADGRNRVCSAGPTRQGLL